MSEQQQQQQYEQNNDNENLCVVCCKNVEIYSIGICDHPVCYECSTRMRVLCNQNECPICRGHMPKVIFTEKIQPFIVLHTKYQSSDYYDNKYGLIFCNQSIKRLYQSLLEYRCQICNERKFSVFSQLRDHMRKEHGLIYCELCVNNLKIFNFERRCYTKYELGIHRRKGDKDDKSHKGHPLCEFCDQRFIDSDELFRHLRRQHLFCHYCDADGKHQYYNSMDDLKKHFHDEHYLCEEGECKTMPLTAVFKTEIDLKAHIATEHSRYMSKLATKQARTLELEFTLAPRPRMDRNKRTNRYEEEGAVGYHTEPGGNDDLPKQINALRLQDFPALGGNNGNNSTVTLQTRPMSSVSFTSSTSRPNPFSGEDFPTLGGSRSNAVTITTNSIQTPSSSSLLKKKSPEVTITRTVRNDMKQNLSKTNENFPCLGPSTVHVSVNNSPKVSIHVNHNGGITSTHITTTTPSTSSSQSNQQQQQQQTNDFNVNQRATEAFPALGNTTVPIQPKWVQPKSKKHQQQQQSSKITKVAPAPKLPTNDFNQFPSLSRTIIDKKKTNSVTVPVNNTWMNINSKSTTTTTTTSVGKNKTKKQQKSKNSSALEDEPTTSTIKTINESKNGVVKKRSELKIGELSSDDVKPPPGFTTLPLNTNNNTNNNDDNNNSNNSNNNNVQPPPGFENFQLNDLTFTNSSGQSYTIKPKNHYYQPKNFTIRNQNLIKTCQLNNDLINEFKSYSYLYKIGELPVKRYYEYCKCILDKNFDKIFPELLVLLPDIDKQQELYQIYDGIAKKNLIICENCQQVIYKNELNEHYNNHMLDSQFPSLTQTTSTINDDRINVWKK